MSSGLSPKRLWSMLVAVLAVSSMAIVLAPAADAKVKRNFYGIAPELGQGFLNSADYGAMRRGKVGAMRFLISWNTVQRSLDSGYNWSAVDNIVDSLAHSNVEPRPFFYGSLRRNSAKPPLGSGKMKRGWKRFVRAAVNRYGRKGSFWKQGGRPYKPVKVWQILNEQNSSKFYKPRPRPKQYAKLIKLSARPIRAADKRADIVLGGMFGTPQSPRSKTAWQFLNRFYKSKRIKRKFDGVAVHPYSPGLRGVKYQMRKIRRVMKRNGDKRTKVYVTELGWGSDSGGNPLNKGRQGQARMLKKSFGLLKRNRRKWKIAGVFWYTWRDPSEFTDSCVWCPSAGMLETDFGKKPSWHRFTKMTGGTA